MTVNCTEKDLETNLGIYGEIEKIDYFNKIPPFAFVHQKSLSLKFLLLFVFIKKALAYR